LGDAHDHGQAVSRTFTGQGTGAFTDAVGGFSATGTATHLGAFTHFGTLVIAPTADPHDDPALFTLTRNSVHAAASGDGLYAALNGTLTLPPGVASGPAQWVGAAGRFPGASGSASLSAQLGPGGSFVFTLSGDIVF